MKKIIVSFLFLSSFNIYANSADSGLWEEYSQPSMKQLRDFADRKALKKRTIRLNRQALENRFVEKKEIDSFSREVAKRLKRAAKSAYNSQAIVFELPLPSGKSLKVSAVETSLLSQELAEQYPESKSWNVVAVDNENISGKVDLTSEGLHAMLSMPNGDTVFIDPDKSSGNDVYQSLSKKENPEQFHENFACKLHDYHHIFEKKLTLEPQEKQLAQIPALDLKTYRLALAATAEYTASQGGTKTSAFASMVTTINRVNQIYERDLGISLQIVTGEEFVYTDTATDPYTNSSASAMVAENIENLANNLGNDNFDIGHVFAQGSSGGLAYVGVACLNGANTPNGFLSGIKAGGATGTFNPQGEVFSIEYVAHEIGHQLGADHTFNSTQDGCGGSNRSAATAVEPGSGSTVMSYTGLCGSDNLQVNSDAVFHIASITQINDYTRNDSGASCGTDTSTGNQNPVADAGADISIPANTPFMLDGSSTGGIIFNWDQIDTGTASAANVDTGDNAIIRSYLPDSQEDRFIPKLGDLFNGTQTFGEILPQTTRELNFSLVVRDNNGGIGADTKTINVTDTASTFSVVSQSVNTTLQTNQNVEVLWNVASTDVPPISCPNVDVQLLSSNGKMNMLLKSTANDGYQVVNIPESTPNIYGARMMVMCSDHSFFNISQGNISIVDGVPDTIAPMITINGDNPANVLQGSSYEDAGAAAEDNLDGSVAVLTTGNVDISTIGSYQISYTATDSSGNSSNEIRTVNVVADGSITNQGDSVIAINTKSSGGSFAPLLLIPLGLLAILRRRKLNNQFKTFA